MTSNTVTKVCIKTKQYNDAYKKSGHDNRHDFNSSIGLAADVDYTPAYSFLDISEAEANKRYVPYIIKGGIPMGGYEELIIVDEKLFDYSKIKYEFYND
jgi:glutaredoxin